MRPIYLIFPILFHSIYCYQFDIKNALDVRSSIADRPGLFGYSLDLLKSEKTSLIWILAGAPKQNSNGTFSACQIDLANEKSHCDIRDTNVQGAEENFGDNFSDQLLGISVLSQPSQGREMFSKVWTCAPRFQRPRLKEWGEGFGNETLTYSLMLGHCFIFSEEDAFRNNKRVIPLENNRVFFGRDQAEEEYAYGTTYAETGMSIHLADNEVFMGAPGAWNWTGTMVVTDMMGNDPVMTQPWAPWEPRLNDYSGYAITSGVFLSSPTSESFRPRQFAIGAPRAGANRTGTVFVVEYEGKEKLTQIKKLNGRLIGEQFGSALASADLNGDGLDEIIVGAPLFTNLNKVNLESHDMNFEEGRISIHEYDQSQNTFVESLSLYGNKGSARFGHAIASLGDLDSDGFDDFIVGSPFEDKGFGAIRVYYGKKNIPNIQEPGQTIRAADFSFGNPVKGFGLSFSSSLDIDENGSVDIAIGAPNSGQIILLRSHPSATVDIQISPDISSIDISNPKDFSLDVCLTLRSTLKNLGIPLKLVSLVEIKADKRSHFLPQESQTVTLSENLFRNQAKCSTQQLGLKESFNPSAEESPLVFKVEVFDFTEDANSAGYFCQNCAKLDIRADHSETMNLPFETGCEHEICVADLAVEVTTGSDFFAPFVIGSVDFISLVFTVINVVGDLAFKPYLSIPFPNELLGIRKLAKECKNQREGLLICDIPFPLKSGQSHIMEIQFDVSKIRSGTETLNLPNIEVNSKSKNFKDSKLSNNRENFQLELKTVADLEISGPLVPGEIEFGKDSNMDVRPNFQHSFQIRKTRPSPVYNISTKFDVPKILAGKSILTFQDGFLNTPSNSNQNLRCQILQNVDRKAAGPANSDNGNKLDAVLCSTPGVVCDIISCPQFDLPSSQDVANVELSFQISYDALSELVGDSFTIGTEGHVRFPDALQQAIEPSVNEMADDFVVYTQFTYRNQISLSELDIWQVVVAVIGALIVLAFVLICCVWLGFFKRERKEELQKDDYTAEEMKNLKEPLPM